MKNGISRKELKEQAQVKAVVLKLTRMNSGVIFYARKVKGLDWYEVICNDWELYIDDEMFDFMKKRFREKFDFKILFCYSSNPLVNKGEWTFQKT